MARNFREINAQLDPDTIIFLGDLFDGGREWAPDKARQLKTSQRKRLESLGVLPPQGKQVKRGLENFNAAFEDNHLNIISTKEKAAAPKEEELRTFVPGENGRWSKWTGKQWGKDFERFSRIFFAPEQLYPTTQREMFPAFDVHTDRFSVDNGARDVAWQEYATTGGKSRRLITSLPGNHDLGFGAGVQLVVRDRFQSHFGDPNRIDVIGNHTFISLDTPSLSAHNQYMANGYETESEQYLGVKHIWKPSMDFVNNLRHTVGKTVSEALGKYYPQDHKTTVWTHEVTQAGERRKFSASGLAADSPKPKPELPIILLSHVPLFRNPDSECGPLREKGNAISVTFGYQYQNVLTQTLSRDIVSKVSSAGEIALVLSGDDHDYCDMPHKYNVHIGSEYNAIEGLKTRMTRIREITVKSFSWAMGVRKPGFLLVSLWNPVDAQGEAVGTPLPTIQTHLCLLPDQLNVFLNYGVLFVFTILVLLVRAIVIALKTRESTALDDLPMSPTKPRFSTSSNGAPKGFSPSKLHQPGSSSTSHSRHNSAHLNGNYLGVQRNYNARARSVSPPVGSSPLQQTFGPLIDRAGFYPDVKWNDPNDDESDEESNLGADATWTDDSQAKWKWRRRTPGPARKALDEFAMSLCVMGLPSALWYLYLIRSG